MQVYLTRKKDEAEIFHRKKVKNKNLKLKLNSESMRLSFNSWEEESSDFTFLTTIITSLS